MKVHTSQAVIATERLLAFLLLIHQPVLTSSSVLNTDHSARENLLSHLFDGYDKRFIPAYITGNATVVGVQMYIYSIDSISEASMDYKMNMLLRPRWNDERLSFNSSVEIDRLELDVSVMDKVWIPDIYIVSEKEAAFHNVIVPNKLMHIYPNGDVQYSLRVSGTFACHMQLLAFPFDIQYCKIELESFMYSCIGICFTFDRNYGYYMTQVYIPSMLVVILSWVNFWIDKKSVPARISVGLLTVLTMTTQFSGARANLPRVSYTKAIDIWMACCLMFVFFGLLEYALVNVLSREQKTKKKEAKYEMTKFNGNTPSTESESAEQVEPKINCTKLRCFQKLAKGRSPSVMVDTMSRYVFPTLFAIFNLVYWIHYLAVFDSSNSSCSN